MEKHNYQRLSCHKHNLENSALHGMLIYRDRNQIVAYIKFSYPSGN